METDNKGPEYWKERMRIMEQALLDRGYDYVVNLEHQFDLATKDIEKELANWYRRFADNNISLHEAKRLLNTNELKEFHWTVSEYIKYGRENALDGKWIKQLENASARVHITRLDSMKLQLQQQSELLYANQLDTMDKLARMMYVDSYYHTAYELHKGFSVGYSLMSIADNVIEKVLSKPWTTDNRTFRDRCWTDKQSLVNSINTRLTQMVMRGESPDKAIDAIAKQFNVSKSKAGRLVMTESAAFAAAGQKDCYNSLDVDEYSIVETLDLHTCGTCGALDSKVFKMSEFQVGVTAPPFHPWCRGTTAPYFSDNYGERFARGLNGKGYNVLGDMTYEQWYKTVVKQHGEDVITSAQKRIKNESSDKAQYEKYKAVLGENSPKTFALFQELKYNGSSDYEDLKNKMRNRNYLQNQLEYTYNGKRQFIPQNTIFKNVKTIAGGNTDTAIRQGRKLIDSYGGEVGEWSKRVGKIESDKYIFDVHWYEYGGEQYEIKLKHRKDVKK